MGFWHVVFGIYGGSEPESAPVPDAIFFTNITLSLPTFESVTLSLPTFESITLAESPE